MKPSDREIDLSAIKQHLARKQLVSCMNDTKWTELVELMEEIPANECPAWRCKVLLSDELWGWDRDWFNHTPLFISIEWLEFDPILKINRGELLDPEIVSDRPDFFSNQLKAKGVPHSLENKLIRVWGYQMPGQSIRFE